jgi:hypothetical protein
VLAVSSSAVLKKVCAFKYTSQEGRRLVWLLIVRSLLILWPAAEQSVKSACSCPPAARDNMLMRFAKVTPEGKYVPPPPANSKASFSTMVYVRATIVEDAGEYLARAVTIAVSGLSCCISRLMSWSKICVI